MKEIIPKNENVLTVKQKIDVMCQERSGLRAELIGFEKAIQQCLFSFVALIGGYAAIYFTKVFESEPVYRGVILFIFTQVEYVLALFILSLLSWVNVECGYITAVEKKINALSGQALNVWESEIVSNFINSPSSPFVIAIGINVFIFVFIYVGSVIFALHQIMVKIDSSILATYSSFLVIFLIFVTIMEFISVVFVFIKSSKLIDRSKEHAETVFSLNK